MDKVNDYDELVKKWMKIAIVGIYVMMELIIL